MTFALLLRIAGWLLPDDERGSAILGDLEELFAERRAHRGPVIAQALLAWEVARSAPALVRAGLTDRGPAMILLRTVPALAAGYGLVVAPLVVAGAVPPFTMRQGIILGFAAGAGLAMAGGWVAGALAGAAPRQHALGVGIGVALSLAALAVTGRIAWPLWSVAAAQLVITWAAAYGGARYRSERRRPKDHRAVSSA